MQSIIPPIDRNLLMAELNEKCFLRKSNFGEKLIYIVDYHNAPNVLLEIGRLREMAFRDGGGGTGKPFDLDDYDTNENCYKQLVVWDNKMEEIVGGYRFMKGSSAIIGNKIMLSTATLFNYSENFVLEYLPKTIELGRSFVQPAYQPKANNRKGLFSLDNLWDGLGALIIENPEIDYFFGKITMYKTYNRTARDLIIAFMYHFFPAPANLVTAKTGLKREVVSEVGTFLELIKGLNYKEAHTILNQHVRKLGENIPPMFNAYMNLTSDMYVFDTAVNFAFGEVEETGILVNMRNIYPSKYERHMQTYLDSKF